MTITPPPDFVSSISYWIDETDQHRNLGEMRRIHYRDSLQVIQDHQRQNHPHRMHDSDMTSHHERNGTDLLMTRPAYHHFHHHHVHGHHQIRQNQVPLPWLFSCVAQQQKTKKQQSTKSVTNNQTISQSPLSIYTYVFSRSDKCRQKSSCLEHRVSTNGGFHYCPQRHEFGVGFPYKVK